MAHKKDPTADLDYLKLDACNSAIQILLQSRQGLKSWFTTAQCPIWRINVTIFWNSQNFRLGEK